MQRFRTLTTRTAALPADNVDTDQIIPARFLKGTTRDGLGERLFADWRFDEAGRPRPGFVLNRPEARGAGALLVGRNFGCGSSREHAVWALRGFGFRAIVGLSFADIFRANALKNGLLPVALEPEFHGRIAPGSEITIDLEAQALTLPDGTRAPFSIEPFARHCLLEGVDELDFILSHEASIAAFERAHSQGG